MAGRPTIYRAMRLHQEGKSADALAQMKAIAAAGHRRAAFHAGQILSESGDPAAAVEWYRKSADAGWAMGAYNLGVLFAIGKGVEKDFVASAKWYERAAELGLHDAAVVRGTMWSNGEGPGPDMGKAIEWWMRAARAGVAKAMFYIGESHRVGAGVPRDEVEAVGWYLRAVEIEEANITVQRFQQLREIVEKRAKKKEPAAVCRWGQMLVHGAGVERDVPEGALWLENAAPAIPEAARELADLHRTGEGVEENLEEAVRLYESAANRGDQKAQHALAYARSEGLGGERNLDEAIRWYRASAEQGALHSLNDLGVTLQGRDPAASLACSLEAAERGYRRAMLRVGMLLRDGTCGPRDPVQALRWLFRALANGLADAVHEMHALGRELTDEQIVEANRLADDDGTAAETLIAVSRE